ncbi:MAG TPA: calcium-binding protein [Candidatus Limnocylindrales bacterium]|nr:calcium-binding protein [Candidatus Limnocylindrales bacterium]
MIKRTRLAIAMAFVLAVLAGGQSAVAASFSGPDGKEWRQLYETTSVSWNQVAAICPQDGVTPCEGSIGTKNFNGWVWATADQVVEFLGYYEPALLTAEPPSLSGTPYFGTALGFLNSMRWTIYQTTTYTNYEAAYGWTASTTEEGAPIQGSASFGWYPFSGSFSVGPSGAATDSTTWRGVWLWSPTGNDHTAPVISPIVEGTQGTNGWYTSNVSVAWNVQDAESAVTSKTGCDPSSVTADTAAQSFTCQATSAGGTASATTTVKRDTTAPTVTCGTTPVFEIYQVGARVFATVADATSGPVSASAYGFASTSTPGTFSVNVVGTDRAGHTTTKSCPYKVVIPTCRGLAATHVGTALNDTINGTIGRDIIVALGGADKVNGGSGDDVICGGDGPDTIKGDGGKDIIDGGASPDDIYGGAGDDNLDGGLHNDSLRGENGRDTCTSGETRMSSCEVIK